MSTRKALLVSLIVSLGCLPAAAQPPAATRPVDEARSLVDPIEAMQPTLAKLRRPITVTFDRTSLRSALDAISERAGLELEVDWLALELLGVDEDRFITLSKSKCPAEDVIDAVLTQASAELGMDEEITFGISGSRVFVSTGVEIQSFGEVVWFHPVGDLLNPSSPLQIGVLDKSAVDMTDRVQAMLVEARLAEPEPKRFNEVMRAIDPFISRRRDRARRLTEVIQDTTSDPVAWLDERHVLDVFGNSLMVRATPLVHLEIQQRLTQLREQQRPDPGQVQQQLISMMVSHHLLQAESLRRTERWDEALHQVDLALRLDPENATALAMRRLIQRMRPVETSMAE